jgi:hypothetical protein
MINHTRFKLLSKYYVARSNFGKQIGTGTSPLIELFVHVIYESPNTIVLQGDLITESSTTSTTGLINTDLWAAMEKILQKVNSAQRTDRLSLGLRKGSLFSSYLL